MFKNYWPRGLIKFLPFYWFITILYTLPFFFSFMFFKNAGSIISAMSMLVAVFLMVLLVDWFSLIILSILGISLAWVCYLLSTEHPHLPITVWQYLGVYLFTVVAGTVFNFKSALLQQQRVEGMAAILSNVAHELRTPLLGLKGGVVGLQRYVPLLLSSYELAEKEGIAVPRIRKKHFKNLSPALGRMEKEIVFANTIIDMLLMNVGKVAVDHSSFEVCSIGDCVKSALERYPFDSAEEEAKIYWNSKHDFNFMGSHILMEHIFFNLLKNALHFIVQEKTADIHIWLTEGKRWNQLHFKDTGQGINPEVLQHIFDRFYTTTLTGTGIGLTFCKSIMSEFGGDISCDSIEGEFTEFILKFPKGKVSRSASD